MSDKPVAERAEGLEDGLLPAINQNLLNLNDRTPSFLSPWTNPREPIKSDAEKFAGDEIYEMLNERSPLKIHDFDLDQLALSDLASPFEIRELNFDFPPSDMKTTTEKEEEPF